MKIPECSRVGVPPPVISGIIESLEGLSAIRGENHPTMKGDAHARTGVNDDASLSRLVFLLSCYMDTHFDEPVSSMSFLDDVSFR